MTKTNSAVLCIQVILSMVILISCGDDDEFDTKPLALVNGNMIDGTGSDLIQDAVVVVADDRIVVAGPAAGLQVDTKHEGILNGVVLNDHIICMIQPDAVPVGVENR